MLLIRKKKYFSDNHSEAVRRLDPTDVFSLEMIRRSSENTI